VTVSALSLNPKLGMLLHVEGIGKGIYSTLVVYFPCALIN
jgi:hypothetical protein